MALATALGVGTFATYDTGKDLYVANGDKPLGCSLELQRHGRVRDRAARPDEAAAEIDGGRPRSSTRCRPTVPVDAPWKASSAAEWETYTLERWIEANSARPASARSTRPTRPIFGAEPRELSLLFMLFYIAPRATSTTRARSSATSTPAAARSSPVSSAAPRRSR